MSHRISFSKILRSLFLCLAVLILMVFLYVCLLIAQPQPEEKATSPSPSAPQTLTSPDQLQNLIAAFPAPVLCFAADAGAVLVGGESHDTDAASGICRVLTLGYRTKDGLQCTLSSVSPVPDTDLFPREDLHPAQSTCTISGVTGIVMQNSLHRRLYAQTDAALYVADFPECVPEQLTQIAGQLQLVIFDAMSQ